MKRWISRLLCFLLSCVLLASNVTLTVLGADYQQVTNLPSLYITLDGGLPAYQISKEQQLPASFSMKAAGFDDIVEVPITIKGRGNSTWNLPKKPYQIKFDVKTDLLGMGEAKKWILLANYWDKTLMRNAMTYSLANKMNQGFSVEYQFVDVYLNGQYQGNYLLTEKIEFGKERIYEKTENGAVLMELEQSYRHFEQCADCVVTNDGVHVLLKEPERDENFSDQQMEVAKANTLLRLNQIEDAISDGYEVYSQVIDVSSFIDWYIQNELAKNYDAAFVTSSYCYLDEAGMLHMGPVWDVDVCFGNQDVTYPDTTDNGLNYYNYRSDKGAWYMGLFRDETFVSMLKSRWTEIKMLGYLQEMVEEIDQLRSTLAQSQRLDNSRWPEAMLITHVRDQGKGTGGTPYYSFKDEVDYLKDWLLHRIDWLDSQWSDTHYKWDQYEPVATVTGAEMAPASATTSGGIWSWTAKGIPTPTNRKMSTGYPAFARNILNGEYIFSLTYQYTRSRTTDAVGLRLVGVDQNGKEATLLTTMATHVSYAMSQKDAQGYTTLNLAFDTAQYPQFQTFYAEVDGYNATVSVKDMTLYRATGAGVQNPTRGDVNFDKAIDAADALLVLQAAVGKATLSARQQYAAKCSQDEDINAADALLILQFAVKKIRFFPNDL